MQDVLQGSINLLVSAAISILPLLLAIRYFVRRGYGQNYLYFSTAGMIVSTTMALGLKSSVLFPGYVPFSMDSTYVIAPLTEEIAKFFPIALVVWYMRGRIDIVPAAVLSAFSFSAVENYGYLTLFVDWTKDYNTVFAYYMVLIRLGAAAMVHLSAVGVSTIGLKWPNTWPATLTLAMIMHGLYNYSAVVMIPNDMAEEGVAVFIISIFYLSIFMIMIYRLYVLYGEDGSSIECGPYRFSK